MSVNAFFHSKEKIFIRISSRKQTIQIKTVFWKQRGKGILWKVRKIPHTWNQEWEKYQGTRKEEKKASLSLSSLEFSGSSLLPITCWMVAKFSFQNILFSLSVIRNTWHIVLDLWNFNFHSNFLAISFVHFGSISNSCLQSYCWGEGRNQLLKTWCKESIWCMHRRWGHWLQKEEIFSGFMCITYSLSQYSILIVAQKSCPQHTSYENFCVPMKLDWWTVKLNFTKFRV